MATNVLEFHRYSAAAASRALIDDVTIAAPADIAGAAAALARAADSYGLRLLVWHDLSTLEAMVDADGAALASSVFGWSEAELAPWQCRERLLRSPLLRACRIETEPFRATRQGLHTRWRNRLIERIAQDGPVLEDGSPAAIVVPVHLPLGQVGGAILLGDWGDDAAFERCIDTLAAPIARFVRGYVMVSRDERYLPDDCLLTSREIECLNWIAHGKTDFEIGIIIGCSHAGVRYHVTRACTKLGAVNRAQSVFRAAQLGLLGTPCA